MIVFYIDSVLLLLLEVKDVYFNDSYFLFFMVDKFFFSFGIYGFGGKDFEGMVEKFVLVCCVDYFR